MKSVDGAVPDAASFLVRFLLPGGQTAGNGVLVGRRDIITCARVVNAALGLAPTSQDQPADEVGIDFPLLVAAPTLAPLRATVVSWIPPRAGGVAGDDLVLLQVAPDLELPEGAAPGRFAADVSPGGAPVRIYVGTEAGRDHRWTPASCVADAGAGLLEFDVDAQPGAPIPSASCGSPVLAETSADILGLVASTDVRNPASRAIAAVSAQRLRLLWPELTAADPDGSGTVSAVRRSGPVRGRRPEPHGPQVNILHLSELQLTAPDSPADPHAPALPATSDPLFDRLQSDLQQLRDVHGLRPDLIVVTGDLTGQGMPAEFRRVQAFLEALTAATDLPPRRVALVPGDRDVNRPTCQAHFCLQEGQGDEPIPPYWPKWQYYAEAFESFYAQVPGATFTPAQPWSLFEVPDLKVVVAGINSTIAESHLEADHHGFVGVPQLKWFRQRLSTFREREWLRVGALHHSVDAGVAADRTRLSDGADFARELGQGDLLNLVLHSPASLPGPVDQPDRPLPPPVALSMAAAGTDAEHAAGPYRYQFVTITAAGFAQCERRFDPLLGQWIPNLPTGGDGARAGRWHGRRSARTAETFRPSTAPARAQPLPQDPPNRVSELMERVHVSTQVLNPDATVSLAGSHDDRYLVVSRPLPDGGVQHAAVGVVDKLAEDVIERFARNVHAQYATAMPFAPSVLVHAGTDTPQDWERSARRNGLRLRTLREYEQVTSLDTVVRRQTERLTGGIAYQPAHYVSQRYHRLDGEPAGASGRDLLRQVLDWTREDTACLVAVLGEFGGGKTSLLRQLALQLPQESPQICPILIDLGGVDLDGGPEEVLARHLLRNGVERIDDLTTSKLRFMIATGQVALLLDGFDEVERRHGPLAAAGFLDMLRTVVGGGSRAKIVLASRRDPFGQDPAEPTGPGGRLVASSAARLVSLQDFDDDEIVLFLSRRFSGNVAAATERFRVLSEVPGLVHLLRKPQLLAATASLDEDRLRPLAGSPGGIRAAELYGALVDDWLSALAQDREQPCTERDLARASEACLSLARSIVVDLDTRAPGRGLPAPESATLDDLVERDRRRQARSAAPVAGPLLRSEDGFVNFVHRSLAEWFVARGAAEEFRFRRTEDLELVKTPSALATRPLSKVVLGFVLDFAGERALRWADEILRSDRPSQDEKANAIALRELAENRSDVGAGVFARSRMLRDPVDGEQARSKANLRGTNLRRHNLTGWTLADVDLTGADLRETCLEDSVLINVCLRDARLKGSRWRGAVLLGVDGIHDASPSRGGPKKVLPREFDGAVIAGHHPAHPMLGPVGPTYCLDFSPDGRFLALGRGSVVELIDMRDRRTVRMLPAPWEGDGHTSWVRAVAFAPAGDRVATTSDDGYVRVWHTRPAGKDEEESRSLRVDHKAPGRPVTPSVGGRLPVTSGKDAAEAVAFSPDGQRIAAAYADGTARIWDVEAEDVQLTLNGHQDWVRAVAFSPDGRLVATASEDATARIWDARTGHLRTVFTDHRAGVTAVAFSPDGTLLAAAGKDHTTRMVHAATGRPVTTLRGHTAELRGVAFSPDGTHLATASADRTVRVWHVADGRQVFCLNGHEGAVNAVAYSPDGAGLIATVSDDCTVRIWNAQTGQAQQMIREQARSLNAVALSGGSPELLVTASHDGGVRIWNPASCTVIRSLPRHRLAVRALAFSAGGRILVTGCEDATARVWDVDTGERLSTLVGHERAIRGVAVTADGRLTATCSTDQTARIWDTRNGRLRRTLTGHDGWVYAVAFSPAGDALATACGDGKIRLWDTAGQGQQPGRVLVASQGAVRAVAFSPNGETIAGGTHNSVLLHDRITGRRRPLGYHLDWVNAVAFSHDGTLLASAGADRTAVVWSLRGDSDPVILTGHTGAVASVAFSADDRVIVTAAADGTARIWETDTGQQLAILVPLADEGNAVLLSRGEYKLSGCADDLLWWAIKLRRFEPGALDGYDPGIRCLPHDAVVFDSWASS